MFEPTEDLKILVLEDDTLDKMRIKTLLSKSSLSEFKVEYAERLENAFALLEKNPFHVILSDLNVPDSMGIETLIKINKKNPDIAIIAVTCEDDKKLGLTAIAVGAQDYLVKGKFDEYDLSKSIEHAIQRKQSEIRIKAQNNFLNNVLESLTYPFYVLDANNYQITMANSATSVIKAMKGMTCYMLSHKSDKPCEGPNCPCPLEEVKRTRKPVIVEHTHDDNNGNIKNYELHAYPLFDSTGKLVHIIEYSLDITRRKQAESDKERVETQLRQAQKMEAIGTLAGGIAHDFNNMLGAMIGYANLVLQDVPEDSVAYRNQQEVLIAANRARELVKQILTFGREGEESKKPLKISSITREAVRTFSSSLPENIELRENIEAKSSLIMANVIHIHQILMNLCTNASHAMSQKGGLLEVSLTDIDFESDTTIGNTQIKQGQYVKLKISDTGCGMSHEIMERIFEPFFTTKEVGKGTGMGLSVVHGIVKKCDASIVVQSEVGQGTAFSIFFPRIQTDNEKMPEQKSEGKYKGRILLVDDEEVMVDVTKQILERLEYKVTGKTSSVEALDLFKAESDKFDLVITDHRMPKMKGTKLAQELLSVKPDIPIILCTGFSEDIGKEEAINMGIKEYLMKPVTNQDLSEAIEKILSHQEVAA